VNFKAIANRPYAIQPVADLLVTKGLQAFADYLEQDLNPSLARVGAQYGQRSAHRNRVIATQMYEGTGPRTRRATLRMQAHYVLLAGKRFNSEYGRVFDKQGAAMRSRGGGSG
jgi:hypothetical protein